MLFLQKGTSHGWVVAAGRDKKLTISSQKDLCLPRGVYKHQPDRVATTNFANDVSWCGELAGVRITTLPGPQQEAWGFSNKNESSHRSVGQKTRLSSAILHSLWRLRGRSFLASFSVLVVLGILGLGAAQLQWPFMFLHGCLLCVCINSFPRDSGLGSNGLLISL